MLRDRPNAIATAVIGVTTAYIVFEFVNWAIVNAVWSLPPEAGSQACRIVRGEGACWAVVVERFRFMLFGAYPFSEQWRPAVSCALFVALYRAVPYEPGGIGSWSAPGYFCPPLLSRC